MTFCNEARKKVSRDFHLVAGLVAPSHTGIVAENAKAVDGRVAVGQMARGIGGVVLEGMGQVWPRQPTKKLLPGTHPLARSDHPDHLPGDFHSTDGCHVLALCRCLVARLHDVPNLAGSARTPRSPYGSKWSLSMGL